MENLISTVGWSVFGVIILFWLSSSILIVRQKTAAIIEIFGKFDSVKHAGLRFKYPWPIASVANRINLQVMQLSPNVTVKSKDNAFLTIPVNLQFQVVNSKIKEANYELDDPEAQIRSYILNKVRSHATTYTMDELFSTNENFDHEVKEGLNSKFVPYGFKVVDLLIDDPQPSEELERAFNNVLAAQREKDAAKNEADAKKIKMIGEAEAEKESLVLKGEAFKQYRAKIAEGNSEALAIMLGKGKMVEENGVLVYKEIPEAEREKIDLTERDVLNFFSGVDEREAIRSVGKNEGNVIVSSGANKGNSVTMEDVVAIVKSLKS